MIYIMPDDLNQYRSRHTNKNQGLIELTFTRRHD